jgi:hypothetical protein
MDESDAMMRAGCARRGPQKLQTGNGYARGGRVAMDRYEGKAAPPPTVRRPPVAAVPVPPVPPMLPRRER